VKMQVQTSRPGGFQSRRLVAGVPGYSATEREGHERKAAMVEVVTRRRGRRRATSDRQIGGERVGERESGRAEPVWGGGAMVASLSS
jgi:hypothetical protein